MKTYIHVCELLGPAHQKMPEALIRYMIEHHTRPRCRNNKGETLCDIASKFNVKAWWVTQISQAIAKAYSVSPKVVVKRICTKEDKFGPKITWAEHSILPNGDEIK